MCRSCVLGTCKVDSENMTKSIQSGMPIEGAPSQALQWKAQEPWEKDMVFAFRLRIMAVQGASAWPARTRKSGGHETGVHLNEKTEIDGNSGNEVLKVRVGEGSGAKRKKLQQPRLDLPAGTT